MCDQQSYLGRLLVHRQRPGLERDAEAAVLLEKKVAIAARDGWATSDQEIHEGVWAAAAPVLQGKRMVAAITVPSPLVRAPASLQHQLVTQVRSAARAISDGLRAARR